jgi:hypothetical protein
MRLIFSRTPSWKEALEIPDLVKPKPHASQTIARVPVARRITGGCSPCCAPIATRLMRRTISFGL